MSLFLLPEHVQNLDGLAPKEAGSLIRPIDWNKLVGSVRGIGEALQEYVQRTDDKIDKLKAIVDPLTTQVDKQQKDLAELQVQVAPLLKQLLVTLRTDKVNYALGELCEITAEVRDLSGNIVASRPWIDFITTWGQLQAATGFSTSLSANGSSISVQANAQGIARIRVKAAHTENLSEVQDLQVSSALESTLSNGMVFYQAIMASPTPASPNAGVAFAQMNSQYELVQNNAMQLFLDSYQTYPQYQAVSPPTFGTFGNWKHYRTVVVAIAKPDGDPTTPDSARGSASIQVNFRDWVGPWISGYTNDFEIYIPDLLGTFTSQLGKGSFHADLEFIENTILADLDPMGPIARQRYYNAVIKVMEKVNPSSPQNYMTDLRNTVKQAVTLQQLQETPGGALKGNRYGKAAAMSVLHSVSGYAASAKVLAADTQGAVQKLEISSENLNKRIGMLNEDLKESQIVSTKINQELTSIGQNVLKINTLDQNSVQGQINLITAKIGQINEVLHRG